MITVSCRRGLRVLTVTESGVSRTKVWFSLYTRNEQYKEGNFDSFDVYHSRVEMNLRVGYEAWISIAGYYTIQVIPGKNFVIIFG